jgi:hypothetical protein
MNPFRALILRHCVLAVLGVMAALSMKMVVPTGFMIGNETRVLTVQICDEAFTGYPVKQLVIPMKDGGGESGKHGKGDCPFTALSMASLTGADAALLALALVFILALGFAPLQTHSAKPFLHLRPPLRGPPAAV